MKKTIHPEISVMTKNGEMKLSSYLRKYNYGFIRKDYIPFLVSENRFMQCLIRCGGCRLTCAVQDVQHIVETIENGNDYVRDVSLLPIN
jgi:hypothetical protein